MQPAYSVERRGARLICTTDETGISKSVDIVKYVVIVELTFDRFVVTRYTSDVYMLDRIKILFEQFFHPALGHLTMIEVKL